MKVGNIVSFGLLVGKVVKVYTFKGVDMVDIDVDGSIYSVEVSKVLKVAS